MGLENRDYIRDASPPPGYGYGPRGYWAVKYLLIANIAVFVLQLATGRPGATQWLDLRLAQKQSTTIAGDKVRFHAITLENGRPPRQLTPPRADAPPDAIIPAGEAVEPLAKYDDGSSVIKWNGRHGVVRSDALTDKVTLAPLESWQLVWRLFTYGFCHSTGNIMHIIFNLFVLWMFGRLIEPIYGSQEFLTFFLGGVFISGLAHVAFILATGSNVPAVGASGGVMAVVFLTAMIYPREKVYIFGIIPMEMRVMAVLYAVIDVIGALNPASHTAHWAHLGGAAFGVVYHYFHWRLSGFANGLRRRFSSTRRPPRSRANVRVYEPQEPEPRTSDIDAEVDRLLEKISRQGESSLTDKERSFLADASRRYRKR